MGEGKNLNKSSVFWPLTHTLQISRYFKLAADTGIILLYSSPLTTTRIPMHEQEAVSLPLGLAVIISPFGRRLRLFATKHQHATSRGVCRPSAEKENC